MSNLKTLIRDGDFLWQPYITKDGKTDAKGPFCVDCRVELKEVYKSPSDNPDSELNYLFPPIPLAHCVKCKKDIEIPPHTGLTGNVFNSLRADFLLILSSKNLEHYKVVSLDELSEKEEADTKRQLN